MLEINKIYLGDCLEVLKTFPNDCIDCVVTSPPYYGLRDYGVPGQLGLEKTFHEYLNKLIEIFAEVKRVLKPAGTIWVNLGDSYYNYRGINNHNSDTLERETLQKVYHNVAVPTVKTDAIQQKSLMNIPSRFAIKMTDELNLIQRNEIIWYKRNCMPSSVKDRFTVDFEKIYFFVKNKKYYFEQQFEKSIDPESYTGRRQRRAPSIAKYDLKNCQVAGKIRGDFLNDVGKTYPKRNKRCVWEINTKSYREAHFAVFPEKLCVIPIQAGCPVDGVVMDIFAGSGTTLKVAKDLNRNYIGIELNPEYIKLIEKRLSLEKFKLAI